MNIMKIRQLIISGAILAVVSLSLSVEGCHSNGAPQNSNNMSDTIRPAKIDSVVSTPADTAGKRRMNTTTK